MRARRSPSAARRCRRAYDTAARSAGRLSRRRPGSRSTCGACSPPRARRARPSHVARSPKSLVPWPPPSPANHGRRARTMDGTAQRVATLLMIVACPSPVPRKRRARRGTRAGLDRLEQRGSRRARSPETAAHLDVDAARCRGSVADQAHRWPTDRAGSRPRPVGFAVDMRMAREAPTAKAASRRPSIRDADRLPSSAGPEDAGSPPRR